MIASRVRRRLLAAIGSLAAMPRAFAQPVRKRKTVGIMTSGGSRFLARTLVKHGWVEHVVDWPHSSFHRFVRMGNISSDWGG